jgi:hypothetical protein
VGAKLATGLPFPIPSSASLDSFLDSADAMVGEAFSAAGVDSPEAKAAKNISQGKSDAETQQITGSTCVRKSNSLNKKCR